MTNATQKINTGIHEVSLLGDLASFTASLAHHCTEAGLDLVTLTLSAAAPAFPPQITLAWTHPIVDIHAIWHPAIGRNRSLSPDWLSTILTSSATINAPVVCLHSASGANRLTLACSDALNPVAFKVGVVEETAQFDCAVKFFTEPHPAISKYEVTLRLDTRNLAYHRVLKQVQEWWAAQPGYTPAAVPETARLPMYSTWYSFHQNLAPAEVEAQCRLAKSIGCEAVIVDDGWQNSDSQRGYASCGDWTASPQRFPDMKAHVAAVHESGLKFLLWYALPLVGRNSAAYKRFSGKFLQFREDWGAGVLDPRFPDVRKYLIGICENAIGAWDLDGFKLDFVDCFYPTEAARRNIGGGRDFDSVSEAADALLAELIQNLRKIKPDVMIEFRQSYIGPLMRKYGNMFRASDCPSDAITNRVRTLDIRLLCGNTAAHADMVTWHLSDPVESAALQLLNVLFSVPQISVRLDKVPQSHVEMLKFWLAFWRKHRDVLLDGELLPLHPESLYPVAVASSKNKRIAVAHDEAIVPVGVAVPKELFIVNATRAGRVVIETDELLGGRRFETFDCQGRIVRDENRRFQIGAHSLPIPPAGLCRITP